MKSQTLSPEQVAAHERQQARLAERAEYAGHFTVNEAAKLVDLTPNAVEQAIHSGRLRATKIAYPAPWGSWRIDLADLRTCWPDLQRLQRGRPRKPSNVRDMTDEEVTKMLEQAS